MPSIEIIHLRTYDAAARQKALVLAGELIAACTPDPLCDAKLWHRADLDSDVCIILFWRTEALQSAYSPVGLQMVEDLMQFGWATHSVWQNGQVLGPSQVDAKDIS